MGEVVEKKDRKIQKWRIHSLRVGGEIKNGEHMVYGWVGGKIKKWRTHGLRVGGWENRKNGEYIVYMCVVNPENYS